MYRISKVLNHNTVIGIHADDNQEYLVMGKGIGFGKKVSERIEVRDGDTVYSLQATSNRGNAKELATSIQPIYLEIANEILDEAEKVFQNIDRAVLFPMADHLEYAVKRIQNHEQISNPLTDDIRVLFHLEYKTAECVGKNLCCTISDAEVGYLAMHIERVVHEDEDLEAIEGRD